MIVMIEGMLSKKEPTFLHVKLSNGISYGVFVSLFTSSKIKQDEMVSLHVKQIIKEDAHLLYGFLDIDEKNMFEALIKINGIGATTALAVCSSITPSGFAQALMHSSVEVFKKVPGIGPKSAKRILVELSEFALTQKSVSPTYEEASLALQSLGFKKDKITQVLQKCTSTTTSEMIKEALKKL